MKILYSPLGFACGSLFSAIVLTRPDHVIVITSQKAAQNLPSTVEAATRFHPSFTIEAFIISDPFAGFNEGRELAKRLAAAGSGYPDGSEFVVNIAGGTTALQDCAQAVARMLGANEVAVIDRREPEEQRSNPFVVGELAEIPS
jgi:hypothetical protein